LWSNPRRCSRVTAAGGSPGAGESHLLRFLDPIFFRAEEDTVIRRGLSVHLSRRDLLASSALLASLPAIVEAQDATPIPSQTVGADWPLYGADLADTRIAGDSAITAANVATLHQAWSVDVGGAVNGTPVIAGGTVYIGSYTGTLFALDLISGATVWTYDTGAAVLEPNLKVNLGILGSAAVADGAVYVGDATATLHALDAASGTLRWKTKVDDQRAACIWSSPIAAGDAVYVGVASVAKETGFRGNVVALDAATGAQQWKTYSVPGEADGGGVFAVPALDRDRGLLYAGTQNAYSANPAPYGNPTSVLALDLATGKERWVFNAPPGGGPTAPTDDVGFSASPNLFSTRVFGKQRDLVGIGQKSGLYWALDRDTGDFVWRTQVAPAGPLGGMEGTSGVAGARVIVPAANWPDPSGPAAGLVTALDAATGKILWSADQTAPAASPVAIAADLALQAGLDGILHAYDLQSGRERWQTDLGASVSSGIAVSRGTVVLAAATPPFAPFVRPGTSVYAFSLTGESSRKATPTGDGTGG
jgi:outer membrane protein assembly factor BamB